MIVVGNEAAEEAYSLYPEGGRKSTLANYIGKGKSGSVYHCSLHSSRVGHLERD